jgi:hypothetical protein
LANTETVSAEQIIAIALSQGGLQSLMKAGIDEITPYLQSFQERTLEVVGSRTIPVDFCYRIRIGIK